MSRMPLSFNKHAFFCNHLSTWLYHAHWRYVTLLSAIINSVDDLPDDCDALINELLLRYPAKPLQTQIAVHLLSSSRVQGWFRHSSPVPKITHFNLETPSVTDQPEQLHPAIDTLGDLSDWLELTQPQLDWFANIRRHDTATPRYLQHYRYQLLDKCDGSKRLIEKPKTDLKRIQRKIYDDILSTLATHPAVHGFCKERSCLSHASIHAGKQVLLLFDLTQCFQSIRWPMVKAVFKRMGYSEAVSIYLTALCTHSVRLAPAQRQLLDPTHRNHLRQRHLPQGAPSSPALANAALYQLDRRLTGLADRLGLDYSRYADDIAMSGNCQRDWRFLQPLIGGICLDEGVTLNYKKTRIRKPHQKQRVVGIVVNRKPNIDRQYFDTLKATLTNCRRYGLDSQNREGHPHFRAHLLGRIAYVKNLNKQRGLKLEQIYHDIS